MKQEAKFGFSEEGKEPTVVTAAFSKEEISLFRDYIQLVERVCEVDWVTSGCPATLNISWTQGESMKSSADLPDWQQIDPFLLRFRPFTLKKEATYLFKVTNCIAKGFNHSLMHRVLDPIRARFKGDAMQAVVGISSNGVTLNSPDTVNNWLNAFEYHQDKEKQEWLESLHKMVPLKTGRALFLMVLTEQLRAVCQLAEIVEVVLGESKGIETKVKPQDG